MERKNKILFNLYIIWLFINCILVLKKQILSIPTLNDANIFTSLLHSLSPLMILSYSVIFFLMIYFSINEFFDHYPLVSLFIILIGISGLLMIQIYTLYS